MSFEELTSTEMQGTGPRQAALLVHAMASSDRQWLLAKLHPQEQENLQALLAELESLGIPADRSILTEVLSSTPTDIASPSFSDGGMRASLYPSSSMESDLTGMSDTVYLAQLKAIDATVLATILRSEPALLIARLLQVRDWPWHLDLLEKLSHNKRQKVQDLLRNPCSTKSGAALSDALLRHVRLRYEEIAYATSPEPVGYAIHHSIASKGLTYGLKKWWRQLRGASS